MEMPGSWSTNGDASLLTESRRIQTTPIMNIPRKPISDKTSSSSVSDVQPSIQHRDRPNRITMNIPKRQSRAHRFWAKLLGRRRQKATAPVPEVSDKLYMTCPLDVTSTEPGTPQSWQRSVQPVPVARSLDEVPIFVEIAHCQNVARSDPPRRKWVATHDIDQVIFWIKTRHKPERGYHGTTMWDLIGAISELYTRHFAEWHRINHEDDLQCCGLVFDMHMDLGNKFERIHVVSEEEWRCVREIFLGAVTPIPEPSEERKPFAKLVVNVMCTAGRRSEDLYRHN